MVTKRPRIANKPTTPPPAADSWVKGGGLDPEIQTTDDAAPASTPATAVSMPALTPVAESIDPLKEKGKPYPHRISFDTTKEQYKRLKRACFEDDRSLNDAIREAVEEWLQKRNY